MSEKIQFSLPFDQDLASYFQSAYPQFKDYRILSKSLDARNAPKGKVPVYHYMLEAIKEGEEFELRQEAQREYVGLTDIPIIIGAGPAGLFAALRLAENGVKSIIIERGDIADRRMLHISKYWRHGELNPESNVCFGEGGAGLFSDGKLITRIKSPYVQYVMNKFVEYGAPPETAYISNPHLGSNKIRKLITKMSDDLKDRGCVFRYNTKVTELIFDKNSSQKKVVGVRLDNQEELFSKYVILAAGHSAKEMYHHLSDHAVAMRPKGFAVGVRIEHPREVIDRIQHGEFADQLEAARYKLSYHHQNTDKGTYSFCMCPGGYVLSSGTDEQGLVANGMSNFARNSPWSNAALVVTVAPGNDFEEDDVLGGLKFQEQIERKAWLLSKKYASGKELPAITVAEFMNGKLNDKELPKTSCPSKLFKADMKEIFPEFILRHLRLGLENFEKKVPGFIFESAVLIAPETRTSAPVTVMRDKLSLESCSHQGLYPCGEGAGYAGGITSAAVDGIKVAQSLLEKH